MSPPVIAVTLGDPAGIGPEVTLRALARPSLRRRLRPLLFGDLGVYRDTATRLGLKLELAAAGGGTRSPRAIAVRETSALSERQRRPGQPTRAGGEAAYRAILAAVRAVRAGEADAVVTAPISKANVVAAGHRISGHTELLARLSGAERVRMMMAGPTLRVVLVTTHVALRRVPRLLSTTLVGDTIAVTADALRRHFGIRRPRIAVCGLNPHAGEGGLFGHEDARVIAPAVRAARRRRVDAVGPAPADTVFAQAAGGRYDAVVCMYHDQGLAPFKLIHFEDGVNFTLGLPFVRTSPDHGTAYDIAGSGAASATSMIAALELAVRACASSSR